MYQEELSEQVREVLAATLGVDGDELPQDANQNNCSRWTSVYHMVLLVALEEHFDCTFSMEEMTSMTSVGKIVDVLQSRAITAAA